MLTFGTDFIIGGVGTGKGWRGWGAKGME